jgi:hypothetical protein
MKTTLRLLGFASLATLLFCTSLFAHHSFAAFDMEKTSTLTGTVKEFQWLNPHSWIQMMVKDASGNEVEWSIESNSPSSLSRQGWKPTTLKPGEQITVTMHPLRDGRPGGSLVTVTKADGTKIGGNPAGEPNR